MNELRRHVRVQSRNLRCWIEGENITLFAKVHDVSEGGLFLQTLAPLRAGTRARLVLGPSREESPVAMARVVWARSAEQSEQSEPGGPAGMALAFEELDAEALERLREFVALSRRSPATDDRDAVRAVG